MTEKTQKVDFKTKPAGAEVVVGSKTCITPCTLEIEKGKFFPQAIITLDGYQSQNLTLQSKFEPAGWLNVLNFGVGFIVDYATGTAIKYDSDYYATLAKK